MRMHVGLEQFHALPIISIAAMPDDLLDTRSWQGAAAQTGHDEVPKNLTAWSCLQARNIEAVQLPPAA